MRRPLILLIQSLARVRTLVLAMALVLAAFQVILIVVAGSIQRSSSFQQLGDLIPPFVREVMGPSLAGLLSFSGFVCLGYFHLSVVGSLVGLSIAIGTMPTSEVEIGFMDLILSRPLPRHWIITRSIVVMIISTVAVLGLMMIATWAGLNGLAARDVEWPAPGLILRLAINLGMLMLCWNAVAMAIGAGARRRSVAGGLAGLLALAMFLLDYVGRAWAPAERVAWLSPFRYYSPFELLMDNAMPAKNLLVLAGVAVAGFLLAYVLFSRRDISH
jgi:ABC-2 type transport system permease protein